jgi:Fe-S oxidoreductase/nitrate reductase gamma subunit
MTSDANVKQSQKSLMTWTAGQSKIIRRFIPRVRDFFVHAIIQVRVLRKAYPGIMHALIFWGVVIQVIGTAINLMQMALFIPFVELPFPRSTTYLVFELVMDLAGIAILIGVIMAAFRRIVLRPDTLETRTDDYYALLLLGLIPIVGFTLEATRILSVEPDWFSWSPVGSQVALFLQSLGMTPAGAMSLHPILFWTHFILAGILVASIPFTKMRHLIYTPLNVVLRPFRKTGTLEKIDNIEEAEILGVGNISEFSSQQLLSFDACTRCGRCEEACPATLSGMTFTPRNFIQSLQKAMVTTLVTPNGNSSHELYGDSISDETPWSCTTCGICLDLCPAFINPVDEIIDLRRYQTLTTGKVPKSVSDTLRNMERQGNPWGMPPEDRISWAEGLGVKELTPGDETDILLFLGCAFAFDDRNKKVTKSFIHLLQEAKVEFGILGLDESCCGETARRLGHEYLFQVFAEQNIEAFNQVNFNRIVTQCPHCFNTLKNEYPQMGGNYIVQHYTEFLNEIQLSLKRNTTNGNGINGKIAYHDPCYLGRYNKVFTEPRQLLDDANLDRLEISRNHENSFCCGGGGGQMWLETDPNTRINHRRLEDVLTTNADIVATACPYCMLMFDDALRSKGISDQIQVMDIAEILESQLIIKDSQ